MGLLRGKLRKFRGWIAPPAGANAASYQTGDQPPTPLLLCLAPNRRFLGYLKIDFAIIA
jgi:hypothetical protein